METIRRAALGRINVKGAFRLSFMLRVVIRTKKLFKLFNKLEITTHTHTPFSSQLKFIPLQMCLNQHHMAFTCIVNYYTRYAITEYLNL